MKPEITDKNDLRESFLSVHKTLCSLFSTLKVRDNSIDTNLNFRFLDAECNYFIT